MIRLWRWVKNRIVQDVPEGIALCEFECHKQQCTEREWQTCARRIAWAAGDGRLGKRRRRAVMVKEGTLVADTLDFSTPKAVPAAAGHITAAKTPESATSH